MDQKIGVYICSGCGIGEAIDVGALSAIAKKFNVARCESNQALCAPDAIQAIRNDVESGQVNCVIAAACSGRVKTDEFSFDPMTTIVERVNMREMVAWCQPPGHEDTLMLAEDYLRMGITKVQKSTLPSPYMEATDKTILVVGGGVSGLQAALEASAAGYAVRLVEKEAELGGHMAKWHKNTPTRPPYQDLEEIPIGQTIEKVQSD
ncbi:MAG: CoB--CoM heterodisulfide reductase iron-sulfur subunit A family protein, partial [Deltaproteobacteria bacterium]|nr:CoB--CoM heterodisulfide reductase iron-sulfur subunit A family protein [Deltaproteobacteria bacterium]